MIKNYFSIKNKAKKVKVGPSESMSKSKKNTIDPEEIINNYGADAVRLFIISDSPPEKDVQWSEEGMESAYKFIQKLWSLHNNFINKINLDQKNSAENNLSKFTNDLINKVTHNLENFRYNVIVANLHEMYNFLIKELKNPISKKELLNNYSKILRILMPVIPHFASECFEKIFPNETNFWPEVDKKYLENKKISFVIQINGKKREVISVNNDVKEDEILDIINNNKKLKSYIENKEIIKKIFVPNKIITLIIK